MHICTKMTLKIFASSFFYGNMLQINIKDVTNIFSIIMWNRTIYFINSSNIFYIFLPSLFSCTNLVGCSMSCNSSIKYVLLHYKGCVPQSDDNYVSADISFQNLTFVTMRNDILHFVYKMMQYFHILSLVRVR